MSTLTAISREKNMQDIDFEEESVSTENKEQGDVASNTNTNQDQVETVPSNDAQLNTIEKQPETSDNGLPYEYDVICYYGPITRDGYVQLSTIIEEKIEKKTKASSIYLILTTRGGDPDAGYRIGRALNHYYDNVIIIIPDSCKSAGTLVAVSAKELIIGDLGELGPLDIQLRKTDEMGELSSTLNIFTSINQLQHATLDSFRSYITDIKYGGGVGTKLAAEIAANLTKTVISPIAAQIDPMKLGEHNRALQIAKQYAIRLDEISNNLHTDALNILIEGYPCHSFVIDRKEAKKIFKNVRNTDSYLEIVLYKFSRLFINRQEASQIYVDMRAEVQDFSFLQKMLNDDEQNIQIDDVLNSLVSQN